MPYSVSHAVVALPLSMFSKGKIPIFAVVIGSMSPDFPYFLALTPTHAPGHSLLGVFLYCLIPSMVVLYGWYRWIEVPTLEFWKLSQQRSRNRFPSNPLLILGVLIGALSHVLWDATSHSYGSFVVDSVFWNSEILSLPAYKWNQYGSGLIGLAVLALWYTYALFKNWRAPYAGHFWLGVLIYTVSVTSLVLAANIIHQTRSIPDFAVRTSIGVMSGLAVAIVAYAVIVRVRSAR